MHTEIDAKITSLIKEKQLDAIVLGNRYNIQYATGVRIACSHAQRDLVMFAVFVAEWEPVVIVPHCWLAVARQTIYMGKVVAYQTDSSPLEAATDALLAWCYSAENIGIDDAALAVSTSRHLKSAFADAGATLVPCAAALVAARAVKTVPEVKARSVSTEMVVMSVNYVVDFVRNV